MRPVGGKMGIEICSDMVPVQREGGTLLVPASAIVKNYDLHHVLPFLVPLWPFSG